MTNFPKDQLLIAIASMKGGSGKSKTNLGIACHIAYTQPNARVLLIDACQDQGYLSAMLTYEKDEQGHGLGEIIAAYQNEKPQKEINEMFSNAITKVCVSINQNITIDFLPAASETLGDLTLAGWKEVKRGELLARFISEFAIDYTHIIVDTVPLVRIPTTASVFALADKIALIVDAQDPRTLAGINRFVASARKYGANLTGIITNLYDQKIAMSRSAKEVVETLCFNSGLKILSTIPRSATMINSTTVYTTRQGIKATGMYVAGEYDKSQKHLFDKLAINFEQIVNGMEAS